MKKILFSLTAFLITTIACCQNPNWSITPTDFDNSMSVVAVAQLDGTALRSASNEIGAFVGGELRGTTTAVYFGSKDQYFFFITIYSNELSGETITYKVYNEGADEVVDLVNTTDFTTDLILGELDNPVILTDDPASVDVTGPVASITSLIAEPTNQSSFSVSVSFAEEVNNFTIEDVLAENATISAFSGSDANYSFTVTPVADGILEISLVAGSFTDVTGNLNEASSVFSRLYFSDLIYTASGWSNVTGPDENNNAVIAFDLKTGSLRCDHLYIVAATGVVISENGSLVADGNVVNEGTLQIKSGASFVNDAYSGSGSFTYQRNTTYAIGEYRYSFIGAPVTNQDLSAITGNYKFIYDEATDTYLDASAVTSMTNGVGYTIANNDLISFTGTPNSGNIFVPVTNNGNGFNLVANPYPAAISYSDFMAQNLYDAVNNPLGSVSGTIYIWDDGDSSHKTPVSSDFLTINAMGYVSGGNSKAANYQGYIPSAQGFMVESISGTGGAVLFRNAMKLDGNNTDAGFFRAEGEIDKIKLELTDEKGNASQTLVGFSEATKPGRDYQYDALKVTNTQGVSIYSLGEAGQQYAIQLVDYPGTELAIEVTKPGQYSIAPVSEQMKKEMYLFLQDLSTGEVMAIQHQAYSFQMSQPGTRKFKLFVSALENSAVLQWQPQVIASENGLTIFSNDQKNDQVILYELSGKVVYQDYPEISNGKITVDMALARQTIYIVNIGGTVSKFMIR